MKSNWSPTAFCGSNYINQSLSGVIHFSATVRRGVSFFNQRAFEVKEVEHPLGGLLFERLVASLRSNVKLRAAAEKVNEKDLFLAP